MAAHAHLGEDAPYGPHVDGRGVMARSEQDLWRAVPQCDHLSKEQRLFRFLAFISNRTDARNLASRTYLMCVGSHRNAKRASKAEVGELQVVVLADQQVLRLEVTVEDAMGMAVEEARGELMCEFLRGCLVSPRARGKDFGNKAKQMEDPRALPHCGNE